MTLENSNSNKVFKYNMSFYYQSTIIYFIVFALYLVIKGNFVVDSFTLVTDDPIIYFLALIVIVSILAVLYNKFLNKHIEITDNGIAFINRFKERRFRLDTISHVKFFRQRRSTRSKRFRTVRIKINNRIRPIMFRISDYENEDDLYNKINDLKTAVERK